MSHIFKTLLATGAVALLCAGGALAVDVAIDPAVEYQTIVGFGGNDPRNMVDMLVNDLGMSAHRDWINCETNPTSGAGWSRLRELRDAGVEVFIGSPWSPAATWKWNDNCSGTDATWNKLSNGVGPFNDYRHPNADPEKGGKPNNYPAFANALVNYVKNFESNVPGAQVYAISPQNEPAFAQSYTSCVYYLNTNTQVNQIRDIIWEIGKKLESEGLSRVKIFAAEDMLSTFGVRPYVQLAMNDPETAPYVGALAVHGYSNGINPAPTTELASKWGGRSGAGTYAMAKGIDCWMTETSGYVGWDGGPGPDGGTMPGAQELGVAMYAALKYGKISGWWWWRLAVTESYWTDETLIYNGTPNKNYYVSKVFYKYIRPGAVMIDVNDDADEDLGVIAFRHKTNKTLTIVIVNSATASRDISLVMDDMPQNAFKRYVTSSSMNFQGQSDVNGSTLTVPANSFTTLYATGYEPSVSVFEHVKDGRFTVDALDNTAVACIYTLNGQLVRTIARPRFVKSALVWNSRGDDGRRLPAGSYCAVMTDRAGVRVQERVSVTP